MKNSNSRYIINNNNLRKNKDIIFKKFLKKIIFGVIISIIFSLSLLLLPIPKDIQAQKSESEIEEEMCISYNKAEKLISITCKYTDFEDVTREITDPEILKIETKTKTTTYNTNNNTSKNNKDKTWLLNAGLKVEENALLDINSNDVTWLKIIPSKKHPNAIKVDGSLKVDSVKITSWNPTTNDHVYFSDAVKYDELQYKNYGHISK